jgi:hypothetical protein
MFSIIRGILAAFDDGRISEELLSDILVAYCDAPVFYVPFWVKESDIHVPYY